MKNSDTSYLFFTGKGGVGKTSLSCATAIKLADEGNKVLLVSTDPASNLEDVLQSKVYDKVNPVKNVDNLWAINIDPEISAEEYRNRVTDPLQQVLEAAEIQKMKEELSGACTTEIAAFDEFSRFISGETEAGLYDIIIFDTAPTGHTLRLLELPAAWASFTDENPVGASCLGPASALKSSQERYNTVVNRLRDPKMATFYLVARADTASLKEASRTSDELASLGMKNQKLLINGVFKTLDTHDNFAMKMQQLAEKELASIPENLQKLSVQEYPLLPYNLLGADKLRSLLIPELQKRLVQEKLNSVEAYDQHLAGIDELVEELTAGKINGLIMTMGKGGVGKTITATALAVMIARKGLEVHLTTTDPAAHVRDFIDQLVEIPANLSIDRIDPKLETQRYTDKILSQKGKDLNEEGKKLLLEDLRSPCTEEVAVFHAFSRAIHQAKRKFVIIDTAPTGHTLLLLDTAGSYHREIMRSTGMDPGRIKTPYMALQDHDLSKVILVTLPETTPMREAAALQEDLKRAGISTFAWVINQSLSMNKNIYDPLLKSRALAEINVISSIKDSLATRTFGIPVFPEDKLLPVLLEYYDKSPVSIP